MRYREQQPTFIPPMLLTSGPVPSGDAWSLELKWATYPSSFLPALRLFVVQTGGGPEHSRPLRVRSETERPS